jgi:rhodanese-related sulfurtransferase
MKYIVQLIIWWAMAAMANGVSAQQKKVLYACLPCGHDCDKKTYTQPGTCGHCQMKLVKKSTIRFKNLTQAAMCRALTDTNTVALDVRTEAEFNGTAAEKFGRLKNAINIPLQQLQQRMGELEPLRTKHIILYCSHSHRSPQAAWLLSQKGFKVSNMQGGMATWQDTAACTPWLEPQ